MTDIAGLKQVAEVERQCRESYNEFFHKVAATTTYDQWRSAFKTGFRCGREDAMKDWGDHMGRMSAAMRAGSE